jgi:hypothetical protein
MWNISRRDYVLVHGTPAEITSYQEIRMLLSEVFEENARKIKMKQALL